MVIERSNDLALQFGASKNEVRVMCWLFDRRCFWMRSRGSLGALKQLNLSTMRGVQDKGAGSLALNRSSSFFCL